MSTLAQALIVTLPALYLIAAFLYGMHFVNPREQRVLLPRRIAFASALLGHLALFWVQGRRFDTFPAWEAWTTLSMVTMAVTYLFAITSRSVPHGGVAAIVLGMAAILQLAASSFGPMDAPGASGRSGTFYLFHALTSAAAAGALILSGLYGVLYLWVFRCMRRRQIGIFVRAMPSMRSLANLTRRAALAGFLLLAVGINFGIGWAHYKEVEGFGYTDPWVMAMILIWVHFGVVAFSHRIPGISAKRASIAATAGLTILLGAGLLTLIPEASFHFSGQ